MLGAHPAVFPSWFGLGNTGVRSEYPGSLVFDWAAVPREDADIRVLVDLGLDREAFRRFFYTSAWVGVAFNVVGSIHAVD